MSFSTASSRGSSPKLVKMVARAEPAVWRVGCGEGWAELAQDRAARSREGGVCEVLFKGEDSHDQGSWFVTAHSLVGLGLI
jgi:hypothetical protein